MFSGHSVLNVLQFKSLDLQGKAVRGNTGNFVVSAPDCGHINRNEAKHFSQNLDILHELKDYFWFHEMALYPELFIVSIDVKTSGPAKSMM